MLVRLRNYLQRPVAWGAVLLSYMGIFVAMLVGGLLLQQEADNRASADQAHIQRVVQEGNKRTRDFCKVIVASHDAAVEDRDRLARSVHNSRAYLRERSGDPALRRILRVQLPRTIAARDTATLRANGLKPPATCKAYHK